jgi:hypothetical protein
MDQISDYQGQLRDQQKLLKKEEPNHLPENALANSPKTSSDSSTKTRLKSLINIRISLKEEPQTLDPFLAKRQEETLTRIDKTLQKHRMTQEGRALLTELQDEFAVQGKQIDLLSPEKKKGFKISQFFSYLSPSTATKKAVDQFDRTLERKQVRNAQNQTKLIQNIHQAKDMTEAQEVENLATFRQALIERGDGFTEWYKIKHQASLTEKEKKLAPAEFIDEVILHPLKSEYSQKDWPTMKRLKDGTVPSRTAKHHVQDRINERTRLQNEVLSLIQEFDAH